ncbi:MAG TPA: hypothetical protein VGF93_07120 [Solirubrobacteraceae bacterium]
MDLDAYRQSAETFLIDLTGEHYRHYAGLKETYEIEPIYDRHQELFTAGAIESLRELRAAAPADSDEQRRLRMLLDFAVEGYLGEATKALETELAEREAGLEIELDDRRLGFRESSIVQANEPDGAIRAAIERARNELTESQLGALYRELLERQHAGTAALGWDSYSEMCADCKAIDLGGLHTQTEAFNIASEAAYPSLLAPEVKRTLGIELDELRRADFPRLFRAAGEDEQFPADRLVESFAETMRGLGIDVASQAGVNLDLERRPNKSPRAFCAPVRVPGEVHLVLTPVGGRDDFAVLLHEGGHTEHYANVAPDLAFEYRFMGDNAITEAYAFLFEHLVEDREWLSRRLGIDDADELLAHGRVQRLIYVRRYAAKLAYELELHGPSNGRPLSALADRYAELIGGALQVQWPRETFLADVDPGFYCACYLQAWAVETHLRAFLRERFGPAWFEEREAGDTLRGLWREGQRRSPDELLELLTGEQLRFDVLLDDLGLR